MKNRKKLVILGLTIGLLLALSFGAMTANERFQSYTIYTYTTSNYTVEFTAASPGSGWSWSIRPQPNHWGDLNVYDLTAGQYVLQTGAIYTTTGGNLNITDGHQYRASTLWGNLNPPGWATVNVVSANWNPDKQEQP